MDGHGTVPRPLGRLGGMDRYQPPRPQPTVWCGVLVWERSGTPACPRRRGEQVGTSRVTRVGASLLLGLALSAGPTSSAVGAAAAHPTAAAARAADVEPAASYTISGRSRGRRVAVTTGRHRHGGVEPQLVPGGNPCGRDLHDQRSRWHLRLSLVDPQARYLNGYYDSSAVGGSNFTTSAGAETTVTVGPSKPNINVQLGSGFHIKGTVDDTCGSPITNIQVQAYISSGYQAVTTTASNGTFAALVPGSASYTVAIVDPYGTYTGGYYASNVLGHITAAEGSATPVAVSGSDVTILTVTMEKPWTITLGASARPSRLEPRSRSRAPPTRPSITRPTTASSRTAATRFWRSTATGPPAPRR